MESAIIWSAGVAVQRIRRARWAAWIGLAASVGVTALVPPLIGVSFYAILASVIGLLSAYFGAPKPPPSRQELPGDVAINQDALVLHAGDPNAEQIPRAALAEGWVDSFRDEHRVVLRRKTGDLIWIRVADREEGRMVLRGVGLSAQQHLYTARLVSVAAERLTRRARAFLFITAIYFVLPFLLFPLTLKLAGIAQSAGILGTMGVIAALVCYQAAKGLLPRTAVVGADGVTIKGFREHRFIPFAGISRVWSDERGVWLQRASGEPILLPTMARMGQLPLVMDAPPSADTLVLLDRVKEAMAVGDTASASAARFGALDRRGRPVAAWQRELRALLEREGSAQGYRQTFLGRDELTQLVESVGAAPERRIAAALALSSVDDPGLKSRLRFAVEACANESLRDALDQASQGEIEEAELERATRSQP